jgi:CheY-like chemotaxis protein
MRERVAQLEAIRSALASGDPSARKAVQALGQELRGSGGSFGFPEVTDVGTLLEQGSEPSLPRYVEGALVLLRGVARGRDATPAHRFAWLAAAAGVEPAELPDDLDEAWTAVAEAAGIDEDRVAAAVADMFDLEVAAPGDLEAPSVRLVPPARCVEWKVVPLSEDDIHLRVATADPTDVLVEVALKGLTGRIPRFEVVQPGRLYRALALLAGGPVRAPAPRPPPTQRPGPPTVLVVDDDRGARLIATTVLARKGYGVLEAGDGAEALEVMAGRSEVRLVVADLNMPGMGGAELLRRLKADGSTAAIPVVVLTGAQDAAAEAALIEDGADDYMRKPIDPRLFLARVAATLRRAGG